MKRILIALAVMLLCLNANGADIQKLIGETERVTHEESKLVIVWWIPTEFWEVAMQDSAQLTPQQRAHFGKIIDDYLVVVVLQGDIGPVGGFTPKDRASIEANTELLIGGKVISPLGNDEISRDALNFITIMKPMMANMLGAMGKGMEFLVYPNPSKGAEKIIATKPGSFSYTAFGHQYDWRLPLGSLLPPKIDSKTKQSFPGDYLYNPYTGDKLPEELSPSSDGAKETSQHP